MAACTLEQQVAARFEHAPYACAADSFLRVCRTRVGSMVAEFRNARVRAVGRTRQGRARRSCGTAATRARNISTQNRCSCQLCRNGTYNATGYAHTTVVVRLLMITLRTTPCLCDVVCQYPPFFATRFTLIVVGFEKVVLQWYRQSGRLFKHNSCSPLANGNAPDNALPV